MHQAMITDYGDMEEAEMAELFWPGGEQPLTKPVQFEATAEGRVVLRSVSEGASIDYRIGEGEWQLYHRPIAVPLGQELEARAVRYGWEQSENTVYQP